MMESWLKRWDQRQRELEDGVDADLVRDNRARQALSSKLCGVGLLLLAMTYLQLPGWIDLPLRYMAIGCGLVGFILWKWTRQEKAFLDKPDPEARPKLFKL